MENQNNTTQTPQRKKRLNWIIIIVLVILAAIGFVIYRNHQEATILNGAYKVTAEDVFIAEKGDKRPDYFYFKKDGTLLYIMPETNNYYATYASGKWVSLGNNRFKLSFDWNGDEDHFSIEAEKSGNLLKTFKKKGHWPTNDVYNKVSIPEEQFIKQYQKARESEAKYSEDDD
ncbi:hypothetical protein [Lactobacillus sp. PV034]|uniref:hypothetical protein n=1 Tax=Lactobacillus sp. PV034 TaxID=2594495 RepID=UPI00223E9F42|nr:hypothetical protein [Lactobacillus sp. PV034]QNQ80836.1 hypothetical protein FP432_04340 [Lactobacillus sp. PV034]